MTMWLDIAVALLGLALVTRLTIIATCALLDAARRIRAPDPSTPPDDPSTWPLLSVIVPMYNEREVIDDTLRAILASDYPSFECIVVDDGSTDGCGERVRAMVTSDGLIQLLDQKVNGGKPAALNAGIHAARGQLICTVDADTRLAPDTLTRIAAGLSSPQTSAVACNVKVGNANRWLTRWQSIEYVTALNLDRRAQHTWNTITTVPGAASGWKRAALLSCGGFSNDTMTEDADLSITMLRDGHTIRFLHRAVAYTHAPTDLGALFRQRRRWLFGNLQCAWKHRGGLLGRSTMTLRLLGLPNFWFAHFFAYCLFPLVLVYLPRANELLTLNGLISLFVSLLGADLALCLIAWWLEKEPIWALRDAPLQRLCFPLFLWSVFAVVLVRWLLRSTVPWDRPESGPSPPNPSPTAPVV